MIGTGSWAIALAAVCLAPGSGQPSEEPQHARPRLVAEHTVLVPGRENWLGITFEIDPDWHLYWNGVNDSGMPVSATLELPEGYEAGELLWPAPKRLVSPGDLLDHVYERRVTFLLPVKVPADGAPGTKVTIGGSLEWLVCHDVCLPGDGEVSLTLPIAAASMSGDGSPGLSKDAPLFREARERLPRPQEEAGSALEVGWEDGDAVIAFDGAAALAFYPAEGCVTLTSPIESAAAKSDRLTMPYEMPEEGPPRLVGVLEVTPRRAGAAKFYAIDAKGPMRIDGVLRPRGGE